MAKRRMGLTGFTARTVMIGAAGALVLSYLSIFCNPAKVWFMTLFGLLYLPFLIVNVALAVLAIIRSSKTLWIPVLALLPSLFIFERSVQISGSSEVPAPGDIKVITWNLDRFNNLSAGKAACQDSVFRFLRAQDADIICLQEMYIAPGQSIEELFGRVFPSYNLEYYLFTPKSGSFGNVTLSRFPILNKGKISFENSTNVAIYGDYDIASDTIRIYNCHFQSYNISLARLGASVKRKGSSETIRDTETKMRSSLRLRPKQVDAVIKSIGSCPLDAFVAGDFNDTPMSYTYWKLSRGRDDSFITAGKGFGETYSWLRPLLRIDYLLCPRSLRAISHKVENVNYSDHYPVIATFRKND